MTPGPRDAAMLKHMLASNGSPGGHLTHMGPVNGGPGAHLTPMGPVNGGPGAHLPPMGPSPLPTGPLTVRVNGAPGGRLNVSSLSSKHSVGGGSGSVSPGTTGTSQTTRTTPLDQSRDHSSHVTDISHISHLSPISHADLTRNSHVSKGSPVGGLLPRWIGGVHSRDHREEVTSRGALTSLGLLCLTSLLLALLALTFLVELDLDKDKTSDYGTGGGTIEEVTLALAALTLALDLCCLLVCSAQFIFALTLAKTQGGEERLLKYLKQLSVSRVFAIGAFFISIPTFLTGVILFTFSHFQRTPAILTAVLIGLGIIVCGLAMIHNVFVWQKEKSRAIGQQNIQLSSHSGIRTGGQNISPLPNATLDLSGGMPGPHELSTLV